MVRLVVGRDSVLARGGSFIDGRSGMSYSIDGSFIDGSFIGVLLRSTGLVSSTLELEVSALTRGGNVSTIAGSPRGSSDIADVDIAELAPDAQK